MKLSPNTAPVEPGNLLIRFHNDLGAAVDIVGNRDMSQWTCHGCGDVGLRENLFFARRNANAHAAECRAAYHHLDR
ncbi:hypothetical protein [Streptomyces sp. NPDC048603]|uniref:hypothetical protein n=1 Tax=Streptomyces sp. NPDC048603 TaxID=3365577 RepID=UPI00371F45FF